MNADGRLMLAQVLGKYYCAVRCTYDNSTSQWAKDWAEAKATLLEDMARRELGWTREQLEKQAASPHMTNSYD